MADYGVTRSGGGKKSVVGGHGITGVQFSGKLQERVPATQTAQAASGQTVRRGPGYSIAGGQGVPGANYLGRLHQAATALSAGAKKMTGAARTIVPASAQVISNVVREKTSPTPSSPAAPARMGVNRTTGNTTGFSSGTKTGTTMTKAGTAYKTNETAYQRQQRMTQEKMGVAGPSRSSGGGTSRSSGGTSTGGRGGTGPSGMGYSGAGTGSKR